MFLAKFTFGMKPPIVPVVDLFPPWAEMAPVVKAGAQIFVRTVLLQGLLAASCATAARIRPHRHRGAPGGTAALDPPSFLWTPSPSPRRSSRFLHNTTQHNKRVCLGLVEPEPKLSCPTLTTV